MHRLFALGAGVEERQHLAAGIHRGVQMRNHGRNQRLRQVVERGPQQHHIERAAREVERLPQEALDIPDGVAVLVFAGFPLAGAALRHQIRHEDAVAEAGEKIDVGRRRVADVEDAEAGLGFQPLAQEHPCAGVARHPGPDQPGSAFRGSAFLFLPAA